MLSTMKPIFLQISQKIYNYQRWKALRMVTGRKKCCLTRRQITYLYLPWKWTIFFLSIKLQNNQKNYDTLELRHEGMEEEKKKSKSNTLSPKYELFRMLPPWKYFLFAKEIPMLDKLFYDSWKIFTNDNLNIKVLI